MSTITKEMLEAVKTIIVHKECADGMASAILLHDALPKAEIKFIQYNSQERAELRPEFGMLFCDFSPEPSRTQEFVDFGAIVLDHHKGAEQYVNLFGERGVFADEKEQPGVGGALLAYHFVWCPMKRAGAGKAADAAMEFATLAGIRDTWQTKNKFWVKACQQGEALKFYPTNTLLDLDDPFYSNYDVLSQMMEVGEVLIEKQKINVGTALVQACPWFSKRGTRLLIFNDLKTYARISDAAETAGDAAELVIGFEYQVMGMQPHEVSLICHLRSRTGYDCKNLAQFYGGNGHSTAAGFSDVSEVGAIRPTLNPYKHIIDLVDYYESDQSRYYSSKKET